MELKPFLRKLNTYFSKTDFAIDYTKFKTYFRIFDDLIYAHHLTFTSSKTYPGVFITDTTNRTISGDRPSNLLELTALTFHLSDFYAKDVNLDIAIQNTKELLTREGLDLEEVNLAINQIVQGVDVASN